MIQETLVATTDQFQSSIPEQRIIIMLTGTSGTVIPKSACILTITSWLALLYYFIKFLNRSGKTCLETNIDKYLKVQTNIQLCKWNISLEQKNKNKTKQKTADWLGD